MSDKKMIPLQNYPHLTPKALKTQTEHLYATMKTRRTVRDFADNPVPREVIENCLRIAGTAPSGANMQPWHFVVVSDPAIKRQIRLAAEAEETAFYSRKASEEWLQALAPLGTDADKPFLETAPYLIAIFAENYGLTETGEKITHYYVSESVGIATGFLISAIHQAGLASLTHTPSPMTFLNQILNRPPNQRPYLLLVVGYPAEDTQVPNIQKKPLDKIATFI